MAASIASPEPKVNVNTANARLELWFRVAQASAVRPAGSPTVKTVSPMRR
jgi:hypothetical protein